ncbi:Alpha-dioxygenase 2 [Diplonema papillatum]|nr:Alpha-dioxygenase 2 [Diplonema papillatum]KAJ9470442.1 Alpha-dioxygenase 2 [Diplonema papillatum]KAJ9470443.1 Alpha-dioxygenase 2 [Diplonema papillatum]KAJ9470444.1 Alpha-dioxygenase 2 [Diplonema papillatum]
MASIDQKIADLLAAVLPSRQAYLANGPTGIIYLSMFLFFFSHLSLEFDFSTDEELNSVTCTEADYRYRTADGTCNNKDLPKMGAAGMRFGRNVRSTWETVTPPSSYLWEPRPEVASSAFLHSYEGQRVEIPGLNLFFSAWIQFQTHDWFAHSQDTEAAPYYLNTVGGNTFPLKPTKRDADGYMRSVTTHWWDLSQVYGSDLQTQLRLRSLVDGKMTMDGEFLPKSNVTGQMDVGFTENLWSGLEAMHTLYVKEHNYICDQLKQRNADLDDEALFQLARLINSLQNSHIHTQEWTAILLQNNAALGAGFRNNSAAIAMWTSYRNKLPVPEPDTDPAVAGSTFSHTEDFVAVYKMHALLPDDITVDGDVQPLLNHSFASGRSLVEEYGIETLLTGMAKAPTCKLTTNNYPKSLSNLVIGNDALDMGAIDIFRDRERGMPRYNEFRKSLGLTAIVQFEDITTDAAVVEKLRSVYNSVDDVDLQVGLMAEETRPEGFAIAETTYTLFLRQTRRRTALDRFLTTSRNAETYTEWGLNYALTSTFKRLFENNYPNMVNEFPTGSHPFVGSAFLKKQ